jgi:glycolate oxidase
MPNSLSKILAPFKNKFADRLIFNTETLPDYARDASEINVRPPAIFFPESEADVVEVINFCRENKIPIVFRGAGTGYTGGAVPVEDGLLLSLERLRKLEIFSDKKMAYCGPGVVTIELMKEAERHNLFYPPDPASYEESHLGGNVAECAGGLHCKKYGVTKDYIIGLRAVTIDGKIIKTGIYENNELFNITMVLIGSEGLLAAVTEIAVRLIDKTEYGPTILAAFANPEDAARTVSEITRQGIVPSVMEYVDADSISCSNEYEKVIDISDAAAVLLFETTGKSAITEADSIENICCQFRTVHLNRENDREKADQLWKLRRNISKAVKQSAKEKISEDVCVPPSKLPALVSFVSELNNQYPVRINSYGHAGDGNLHVNFLAYGEDKKEAAMIKEGIEKLFNKTIELGGTLSGEHGIGLTKRKYLHLEYDQKTLDYMKRIKSALDPSDLLNPGKMFLT